jgi:hypothetical protein
MKTGLGRQGRLRAWCTHATHTLLRWQPRDRACLEILAMAFATSRFVARSRGVSLSEDPLGWYVQIADVDLLKERPFETLLYLHGQPPLFNALVASIVALPDRWHQTAWEALLAASGLALLGAVFALLRLVGSSGRVTLAASLVLALDPNAILYEKWLFYSHPTAATLAVAVAASAALAARPTPARGVLAGGAWSALFLLRASWHVGWIVVPVALVWASGRLRDRWRRITPAALAPLLLPTAVYAKNAWIFGSFTGSTWLGMNVTRVVDQGIPNTERAAWVAEKRVSPLATIEPFRDLDVYPNAITAHARCPSDAPILTRTRHGGSPNLENCAYVAISRRYAADARVLVSRDLKGYLRGVADGLAIFTQPPAESALVRGSNRDRIADWVAFYEKWVLIQPNRWRALPQEVDWGLMYGTGPESRAYLASHATWGILVAALLAGLILGGRATARLLGRRGGAADVALALATAACIYGTVVCVFLERGENNRMRQEIEPLIFFLAAVGASRAVRAVASLARRNARRWAGSSPEPDESRP